MSASSMFRFHSTSLKNPRIHLSVTAEHKISQQTHQDMTVYASHLRGSIPGRDEIYSSLKGLESFVGGEETGARS